MIIKTNVDPLLAVLIAEAIISSETEDETEGELAALLPFAAGHSLDP